MEGFTRNDFRKSAIAFFCLSVSNVDILPIVTEHLKEYFFIMIEFYV